MTVLEVVPDRDPILATWALRRIVDNLAESRRRGRAADPRQVYVPELPSPKSVAKIVNGVRSALFPRHAGGRDGGDQGIDYFVGYTLNSALHQLVDVVERELLGDTSRGRSGKASHDGARNIVRAFAEQLPGIRDALLTDVHAAFEGDPSAKSPEEVLLSFPGVHALVLHRLAHSLYELGAPLVARIISEQAHSATGIDIHPGAKIGASCFIDHGTGVVIGETAVIGERVRLYQAVTLGARSFTLDEQGALVKGMPRHPIVQDDVVIYAGATILGRITIGRASVIGGNVWLTRSVPPNSHIVQALARSESFDQGAGI